jgi:hypothetical protein
MVIAIEKCKTGGAVPEVAEEIIDVLAADPNAEVKIAV